MSETLAAETTIVIPSRFNGPEGSGNGGYVCGLIAALAPPGAAIRLESPPPLDTPLCWTADAEGGGSLTGPEGVVASVSGRSDPWPEPPLPPAAEALAAAERDYPGLRNHAFPRCFVCGTEREDGLGLRPGPAAGGTFACRWRPEAEFTEAGLVRPEIVWAALDCPSGWATGTREDRPVVLGSMRARLNPVPAGSDLTVVARTLGGQGRRHRAVSGIWLGQELLATAESVWIALRPSGAGAAPGPENGYSPGSPAPRVG